MTDNEYSKTRKAAVDALIYWAKTGMREFIMRDAVNDYLEASGANRPSIGGEETIIAHRKIAANRRTKHGRVSSDARILCHTRRRKRILNRLAVDCIYALSKEELSKVDRELEGIVGDLPRLNVGIRR